MMEISPQVNNKMSKRLRTGNRILTILVICCLLTIVGLAIAVGVYRNKLGTSRRIEGELNEQLRNNGSSPGNCGNPCLSVDCTVIAGEMLARMNLTVDPCDDFYQYACGTFSKPEKRNPDQLIFQTFDIPAELTKLLLVNELKREGNTYRGSPSTAVTKVTKFYGVCLEDTHDDETGLSVLLELIKAVGSWPISSDPRSGTWSADTWNIEDAMTAASDLGVESILRVAVTYDPRNSSNYIIAIASTGLTLEEAELYKNETTATIYKEYIMEILTLLYGSENADTLKEWANTIWMFESSVANIYPTKAELKKAVSLENIMKLGNISNTITFLNLTRWTSTIFQRSGASIDGNTDVLVATYKYMRAFNSLVANMSSVSASRAISTYLVWTVVSVFVPYAGSSFQIANDNFNFRLKGFFSVLSPWAICLDETVKALGFAAGAIYAEANIEDSDLQKIDKFLQLTRQEFIENLPKADWLQEVTRIKAAAKANAITWQIGFPQYIDTAAKLDSYYKDFNVTDNLFRNVVAHYRFENLKMILKYGKPVDKYQWEISPTETNAYYNPPTNQIVVLAGIMHKPFYDRNFPTSIIYGAVGSILGHELTHGFDTTGKTYNAVGNIEDWWDPVSSTEYDKKTLCFINQYNRETFFGLPVNGNLTVKENIADCGGIKLAYSAYLKAVGDQANMVDQLLPGLNMTGKQQFFLGYSQLWCYNSEPSAASVALDDNHSPSPLRVSVVLRNTPQFAEAFNCPDNSKMKAKASDMCSLW